jgi:hypothetical protein
VAKRVGVTRQTVCEWRGQDERFRALIEMNTARIEDAAMEELREAAVRAVQCITDAVDGVGNETEVDIRTRITAAREVLDRLGINAGKQVIEQRIAGANGGPVEVGVVLVDLSHLTAEQLKEHRKALQKDIDAQDIGEPDNGGRPRRLQ